MAASDPSVDLHIGRISPDDTIRIRHLVLWPDAPIDHVRLPEDDAGFHFAAFLPGRAESVAVISLFKEDIPDSQSAVKGSGTTFRFRKFACEHAHQGQGIGSRLLAYTIQVARDELGARVVWCDARTATVKWYEKRGLVPFGNKFWKGPVEYIRMLIEL
ncbi:GCN5-related N-acetyltransferase [Artomyces pyxidatus]|uniref:GCN5-related N-acetyltransferase n=1 Tax=Artomyces pyxidatus TaxID=48021 RepID=A0ACB8SJY3_9AGAM|nr:GCN5-related N-acetyltransferase [Artomyces pyxidatus]